MRRSILAALLFLALPVFSANVAVGAPAPDVQARLLNGIDNFQLSAHHGQVVIINFWATWCPPCRAEMPAIQAYYDKHKSEGLEILAISMDDSRDLAEVKKIAQQYTFSIAMKSESNVTGLGRIWRMPTTFVVDRDGILRKNGHVGDAEITLAEMEAVVTPLLPSRT
jgi:thiol-disulfide isomerase/thioredoxin